MIYFSFLNNILWILVIILMIILCIYLTIKFKGIQFGIFKIEFSLIFKFLHSAKQYCIDSTYGANKKEKSTLYKSFL